MLDDRQETYDFADQPDGVLRRLLVFEWLRCFRRNIDFKLYCEARRTDQVNPCRVLEKKHEKIAELYEDWGDIHAISSMSGIDEIWPWLENKEHLFGLLEADVVDPLEWLETEFSGQPEEKLDQERMVLIEIPRGLKREQLLKVFDDFVSKSPDILGEGPKYTINMIGGKSLADVLKRIYRAWRTHLFLNQFFGGKRPPIKGLPAIIVKLILKSPEDSRLFGYNWFVHGDANKRLLEQGKLPSEEVKDYVRTIENLYKFYVASIEGTIRGVFPSVTPK